MSNICYMIQLYGNAGNNLMSLLQVVQNSAARIVTRLPWNSPVATLLHQCGWLSVRQMVVLHSLVLIRKIKFEGKPDFLHSRTNKQFQYGTRLATSSGISEKQPSEQSLHEILS